jgi:2-dehydro-3-deoxyphosphooctonate aldolase (KDO 8-P synthase)
MSISVHAPSPRIAHVGPYKVGPGHPLLLLAGPCVIESEDLCLAVARRLVEIGKTTGVNIVFKASFDKANRSSIESFRGPGLEQGLEVLAKVKQQTGLPLVTDIHEPHQAGPVGEIVDLIQIPAFLCRQTDLLVAAAKTGKAVNAKKGQFLAPWDMKHVVHKLREGGAKDILLTDRGTMFGYNNLITDVRAIPLMQDLGVPVLFDATHSAQVPGGDGKTSGGDRAMVPYLARAAMGAGCDGFFMEVHPDPDKALSDGKNTLRLDDLERLLRQLTAIAKVVAGA